MDNIRNILCLFVALLFSTLGASMALAVPMATSEIIYPQTKTTYFSQPDDVSFAARAPPLAVTNVEVTGCFTVMRGSASAAHGQETVAALFGFDADLNAPNRVPGGGLSAHESAGGHLIDRHVGKTSQELIDRANGVGGQRAPSGGVSSYSSVADAERHTSQAISARQADIDAYLANPVNRTAAFDVDIGQTTGQWVPKGGTASQPVTASRVVITPDASMPTGYRIITGHPVPQAVR
jgi:hypothetical protein